MRGSGEFVTESKLWFLGRVLWDSIVENRENDFFFRSGGGVVGGRSLRGSGGGGDGEDCCSRTECENCVLLSVSSYSSNWLMCMEAVTGQALGSDTFVFRRSANEGAAGGSAGITGTSAASVQVTDKLGSFVGNSNSFCRLTGQSTGH